MRVAVTGASGFLGRKLLQLLPAHGYEPIAICRSSAQTPLNIDRRNADDLARSQLQPLLEGADVVIHCAARLHLKESQVSEADYWINSELPLRMANAAREVGVKRFIQLSSVSALSSSSSFSEIIDDYSKPRPTSSYGRAKLSADVALATQSSTAMPIVCLRPPAIFGAEAPAHFRLLLRSAGLGIPLPIGAVSNMRSFVFIDNVAGAIIAACGSDVEGAYIVTDSAPISTASLYRKLLHAYGYADRTFRCPNLLLSGVAKAILGRRADSLLGNAAFDGSRYRIATGWQPSVSLDEAIAGVVAGNS